MKLGLGLGVNSITSQKVGAGFTGILDEYSGAAAAYSVRRLSSSYTDGLIRVRRSSDDTEQDIGFDSNGDLDTTALTTFVNADVNQYTSDFSSTEDLSETNGTGAAAQSAGGVDDAYKFTTITGTGQMFASISPFSGKGGGNSFRIQADVYLPSTNAEIDKVRMWTGYGLEGFTEVTATDTWTSIDQTLDVVSGSQLRFQAYDGSDLTPTTTEANVFYLKNIIVTQTTADGAVTTFYDQSGNGNNATNSTDSEQPLVVSGGSLTQLNSRAAINGDGVDDVLSLGTGLDLSSGYSIFQVVQVPSANTYGITISSSDVSNFSRTMMFGGLYRFSADGTNYDNYGSGGNKGEQCLWSSVVDGSGNLDTNRNGSAYGSQITGVTGTFELDIIGTNIGVNSFEFFQELIVFNSDQSSNRTTMETNINDHFSIYP